MITSSYQVSGMHCGHCVSAVTGEINELSGIQDVAIDLVRGGLSTVTVASVRPLAVEDVRAAIVEAGYDLVPS
jgi:copper chaperone